MYLIQAFILAPYVAVIAMNVLMLVVAPDLMRAELGAAPGVIVPVLIVCIAHCIHIISRLDDVSRAEPPFCCGTPAQLYGEDDVTRTHHGGSNIHVGRRSVARHVHSARPAATPAVR